MAFRSWRRRIAALAAYGPAAVVVNATAAAVLAMTVGVAPAETPQGNPQEGSMNLLVLGDSLTAGYGLPRHQGFTVVLESALRVEGLNVRVIDAGVSGDTSAGGRARLEWALATVPGGAPDAAIVELGANDGLRGLDPRTTHANLDAIVGELRQRGVAVLVAGMLAPPNLGREYGEAFNAVYPRVANDHGVGLYPFFLDGVAAQSALNQADGIHPNAEGVRVIVERILPSVRSLLVEARAEARNRQ